VANNQQTWGKKNMENNNMATSGHTYGTYIDNIDIPDQSLGLARL
jgi:hypothetical protein